MDSWSDFPLPRRERPGRPLRLGTGNGFVFGSELKPTSVPGCAGLKLDLDALWTESRRIEAD